MIQIQPPRSPGSSDGNDGSWEDKLPLNYSLHFAIRILGVVLTAWERHRTRWTTQIPQHMNWGHLWAFLHTNELPIIGTNKISFIIGSIDTLSYVLNRCSSGSMMKLARSLSERHSHIHMLVVVDKGCREKFESNSHASSLLTGEPL